MPGFRSKLTLLGLPPRGELEITNDCRGPGGQEAAGPSEAVRVQGVVRRGLRGDSAQGWSPVGGQPQGVGASLSNGRERGFPTSLRAGLSCLEG